MKARFVWQNVLFRLDRCVTLDGVCRLTATISIIVDQCNLTNSTVYYL